LGLNRATILMRRRDQPVQKQSDSGRTAPKPLWILTHVDIAALHWTTRETLTACCGPPALSVTFTETVYEPAGVVAGADGELLPPPHPNTDSGMDANNNPQLSKRN
jgi:hypothetical protein